jgi:hypothetical protein
MELKLEITKKLERRGSSLEDSVAILNLPAANYCEKRAEMIQLDDGILEQACPGCISQGLDVKDRLSIEEIKQVIDYFATNFGTQFITVNGRGNPFHSKLAPETLEKVQYAHSKGIHSYVFTSGNNLDENTSQVLANCGTNIMISLFGNRFIDANFFKGKLYPKSQKPLQNQAEIAGNLRRLIEIYKQSNQPEEGTTRLGMNYVVSETDLKNRQNVEELKIAANENGLFFVCNTDFQAHQNLNTQRHLEQLAVEQSNFQLRHSTQVNGQCQMGAGSSATVDYNGELFRCPYMSGMGDGRFITLPDNQIKEIMEGYIQDRGYVCVLRRTHK